MAAAIPAAATGMPEIERLAGCGWRLFPCALRAKTPLLKGWPKAASSDLATLRSWAARYGPCNWAVLTGPGSGVFVLDVDGEKGRKSLAVIETQHGPLPATLTSTTGREEGGEHRWFLYPAGHEIRNSTGKLGNGLDIRAFGGYVIVPPSIHPTGRAYQWAEIERPIADAPTWLIECLAVKIATPQSTPLDRWGILPKGKRNDGLTRYAGELRRKGAELPELELKLLEANARRCQSPLEEYEVRKIARSVARYPVGGPDPLEVAWKATKGENYGTRPAQFLALCRHLQSARPGLSIALPIVRIGELLGVHYTMVGIYRKEAVKRGWLVPADQYIAHRRAGHYSLIESRIPDCPETLTKPLKTFAKGLVRVSLELRPSENTETCPSEIDPPVFAPARAITVGEPLPPMPRCPKCGSFAVYRQNNIGTYECLTCDLTGLEENIARGSSGFSEKAIQSL